MVVKLQMIAKHKGSIIKEVYYFSIIFQIFWSWDSCVINTFKLYGLLIDTSIVLSYHFRSLKVSFPIQY